MRESQTVPSSSTNSVDGTFGTRLLLTVTAWSHLSTSKTRTFCTRPTFIETRAGLPGVSGQNSSTLKVVPGE